MAHHPVCPNQTHKSAKASHSPSRVTSFFFGSHTSLQLVVFEVGQREVDRAEGAAVVLVVRSEEGHRAADGACLAVLIHVDRHLVGPCHGLDLEAVHLGEHRWLGVDLHHGKPQKFRMKSELADLVHRGVVGAEVAHVVVVGGRRVDASGVVDVERDDGPVEGLAHGRREVKAFVTVHVAVRAHDGDDAVRVELELGVVDGRRLALGPQKHIEVRCPGSRCWPLAHSGGLDVHPSGIELRPVDLLLDRDGRLLSGGHLRHVDARRGRLAKGWVCLAGRGVIPPGRVREAVFGVSPGGVARVVGGVAAFAKQHEVGAGDAGDALEVGAAVAGDDPGRVGEGEVCELEVHQPALQAFGGVFLLLLGQHEHAHPRFGIAARQIAVFLWLGVVDGEELAVAADNAAQVGHPRDVKHSGLDRLEARGNHRLGDRR
mmetsp:Transcript_33887/g.103668  ORF Transcript_33887/g.103668 Transcript_33887/m.103668 type:complete len:430 (+) Transcript_33887:99-1388(+)